MVSPTSNDRETSTCNQRFNKRLFKPIAIIFTLLLLASCTLGQRAGQAQLRLAVERGFTMRVLAAPRFDLLIAERIHAPGLPLVIYIEGDGHAWSSLHRLSPDPTPQRPLALQLALVDPRDNVIYIARPCQYVLTQGRDRGCDPAFWSSHRFAEPVIAAVDAAVGDLRRQYNAPEVELIGYSGGGAVATLAAARRQDVSLLRTVAGNLNHRLLMDHHRVSPLSGSLNPVDVAPQISDLCQVHYSGERDTRVPAFVARDFIAHLAPDHRAIHTTVSGAEHNRGWLSQWPQIIAVSPVCDPSAL